MYYSESYQNLNKHALIILQYVLFQFEINEVPKRRGSGKKEYQISKHDELNLPYSMFRKSPFFMGNSSITKAIKMLLAHGFLEVTNQGGREKGHRSSYCYIEEWKTWKRGDEPKRKSSGYRRGFTK